MKLDLFDFELPKNLIATHPIEPRDSARLLCVNEPNRTQLCQDKAIPDLLNFLNAGDVLVVNNTRVLPVQLFGKRGDVEISLTLHKSILSPEGQISWRSFAKPAKRLKPGNIIVIEEGFEAHVVEKSPEGDVLLSFPQESAESFLQKLKQFGHMPLPPYMKRVGGTQDHQDYQTVFAKYDGAAAAPTAGLHFTSALRDRLFAKGIELAEVTLHVGAGTFLPVKVDDTEDHLMHQEWFDLPFETVQKIEIAKRQGKRIVALGTTSLRVLESAHPDNRHVLSDLSLSEEGPVKGITGLSALQAETKLFITPGYKFQIVDLLVTNFHLPKSTLFMLVSAFAGLENMQQAYQHAISQQYRFFSYGDACLIYPEQQNDTYIT